MAGWGSIVLGVTGSVAAYKSVEIARRLGDKGAEVTAVLTDGARRFVAPLLFTAVTARPALTDAFDLSGGPLPHLDLARSARAVLVAPASANCLARLSAGLADDLLTMMILATRAPVCLAPAMHEPMWTHPATQRNVAVLRGFGYRVLEPETGPLASGDVGAGRLPDPSTIVDELAKILA